MGFFKTSLPVIVTRKSVLGGRGPWSGKGKLDTKLSYPLRPSRTFAVQVFVRIQFIIFFISY